MPVNDDQDRIRRLAVIAMFSDDEMLERLVLKGGNAVSLIHRFGSRTSIDIDLSMEADFLDVEEAGSRLLRAIRDRMDSGGFVVFDERFERVPQIPDPARGPKSGGYRLVFKVIRKGQFEAFGHSIAELRRRSSVIGLQQERVFKIQISKYEYCKGKVEAELDAHVIYVYSPSMIVIEKLRAICQQLPQYTARIKKSARARDFYDIHSTITEGPVDLITPSNVALLADIFAAKDVPLSLLTKVGSTREYHRPDWPSVESSVAGRLEAFDYYFDFVMRQIARLEAGGVV